MSDAKIPSAASFSADPDAPSGSQPTPKGPSPKNAPPADFFRETVESVVIAFVLAFLFRTFVAEAFVIPTGSMATTLMGRHKDVQCPNCAYQYQASASREADESGTINPNLYVAQTLCPSCFFPANTRELSLFPSYRGDRIIVSKFGVRDPERWAVVVFRYPEQAGTNYIKRLVGLPGEQIRIFNGDLYARPLKDKMEDEAGPFRILRKSPDVVLAMLREVYNNDYVVDWMTDSGWPPRWQPCPMDIASLVKAGWHPGDDNHDPSLWRWPAPKSESGEGWKTADGYRSFSTDGDNGTVWLRYQHLVPRHRSVWGAELLQFAPPEVQQAASISPHQREKMNQGETEELTKPAPQPISDFTGYNYSGMATKDSPERIRIEGQEHSPWVGDLALECEVAPKASRGTVILELAEGPYRFRCDLNLKDRGVRLTIETETGQQPFDGLGGKPGATSVEAKNVLPSGGTFHVRFANVDSRLLLWVDDDLVEFSKPTGYASNISQQDKLHEFNLSPVGIASDGAAVRVDKLRIFRDVYYIYYNGPRNAVDPVSEPPLERTDGVEIYSLQKDQFFVLGDNSAASSDARAWEHNYVERKLLIGKALFIYWPHSWDTPLPFTPNLKRMKFIR